MKKYLPHALVLLIASSVYAFAAEMTDLDTTDGNNTNTTFGLTDNTSPSAVADRYQAYQGAVGRWYADTASNLTVTSTSSTAYTVTANRTLNTLTDGLNFIIEMTPTSGASPTLNVSSLGAKRLRTDATNDLATGAIREGEIIAVTYDATNDIWQVLSQLAVTSGISNVIEDTSPVLGGNLDLGGFTIAEMVTGTDIQVDLDLPTANEITEASVTGERVWSPKLISDAVEAHKAADVQLFNASGTWIKPVTASAIYIEAWGGGGSGARVSSSVGGAGGGGGGYVWAIMDASAVDASETVTIGAGGAAVTGDTTNGNAGGNSSFGTTAFVTAFGGGGAGSGGSGGGGGGGATSVSAGASSSNDSGANAGTFGGAGAGVNDDGTANYFGGGGGGKEGDGGAAALGGGGGGGGSNSTTAGIGGNTLYGGGGGGGGEQSGGTAGGTSTFGGNGGGGGAGGAGTAGSVPGGGGGGGGFSNNSGAGGNGQVRIISF